MKRLNIILLLICLALLSMGMRKVRFVTVFNTDRAVDLENGKQWRGTEPLCTLDDTTRIVAWFSIEDQVRRVIDLRGWVDADRDNLRFYCKRKIECVRDTVVATPDDVNRALERWGYKRYYPPEAHLKDVK